MGEKRSKQSIEEFAARFLDEEKMKTLLDFNDFLITNKIGKVKSGKSTWAIKHKGKRICTFYFHEKRQDA